MSPEDFRKISHSEPKILNSLVNCTQTHRHTIKSLLRNNVQTSQECPQEISGRK